MIRAGRLDREIIIQQRAETVDAYGAVSDAWSTVATVRAQLLQASTAEFLRAPGEIAERTIGFRLRHLPGLTTGMRVVFEGDAFNLVEVRDLGRRKATEIKLSLVCTR